MKALLDTHTFLWWAIDSPKLSGRARDIIGNGNNELFFSAASGWEIAIKTRLGRLQIPGHPQDFILKQLGLNSVVGLPITLRHALHVYELPALHEDPFDRLLVAQAQLERIPILTADSHIAKYEVQTIW